MRETDPDKAHETADAEDDRREAQSHLERMREAAATLGQLGGVVALREELSHPRAMEVASWRSIVQAEIEARS